jgi:hypothetical protein
MKKKKPTLRRKTSHRTPAAHLPKGWTQKRVDEIARYYDNQSDEEAIAELEAADETEGFTLMQVPARLVPQVKKLIAKRAG